MRQLAHLLLATAIACGSFTGCASKQKQTRPDKPEMALTEPEKPPAKGEGVVLPLHAPEDTSAPEQTSQCYQQLGLPQNGGYFLDDDKLNSLSELRIHAEESYIDSSANYQVCEVWTDSMWETFVDANQKLEAYEAERQTWWFQNSDKVNFTGGFVVGVGTTILIVYGLNQASKDK